MALTFPVRKHAHLIPLLLLEEAEGAAPAFKRAQRGAEENGGRRPSAAGRPRPRAAEGRKGERAGAVGARRRRHRGAVRGEGGKGAVELASPPRCCEVVKKALSCLWVAPIAVV